MAEAEFRSRGLAPLQQVVGLRHPVCLTTRMAQHTLTIDCNEAGGAGLSRKAVTRWAGAS
jgi:hypothetical protein